MNQRFLTIYSGVLILVCAITVLSGFSIENRPATFHQINFQREIVVEAGGTNVLANAASDLPRFRPGQLREDFRVARAALEEGHSGLYRYASKAKMDAIFTNADRTLNRPMNAYEFFRVLSKVVAGIKDVHTSVGLPEALRSELNNRAPLLPLQVMVIDRRIYVFRDFAHEDGRLAGRELLAINGVRAARIVEAMMEATPGDGNAQTGRMHIIASWRFNRMLKSVVGLDSPFDLALRDVKGGRVKSEHMDGIELSKLQATSKAKYPQDQSPSPAALAFLDDGRIARMMIRSFDRFADLEKKIKLSAFLQDSFSEIRRRSATTLILDLRDNGGGRDEAGKELFAYLTDKPFKYYEDLVLNAESFDFMKYVKDEEKELPGKKLLAKGDDGKYHAVGHPNWGTQQPSQPNFTGKLFVLINGGCFSGCAEFASIAHYHRRAIFIGEESGGAYYGNTSGFSEPVNLPNTKCVVVVPIVSYYMAVRGYKEATRGIIPDYRVKRTITDWLTGTDNEMSLALRLARNR